ncbi:MAG: YARHG domain-containing protein [Clostridia bacterium]|nr:YARHG domain-containing protein [Clostridia bacterium]
MKKLLITACILMLCLLTASVALADRMYVLPDSSTRRLSRDEVEAWDRDSLYYAYWEIYARHGIVFDAGSRLDNYFYAMPWYNPDYSLTKPEQIQLSYFEEYNLNLISSVYHFKSWSLFDYGFNIWDNITFGFETLNGFEYIEIGGNKVLPVYSAPNTKSWRGANGLAECSSNGGIYAAGYDNGWLLIMYETNNGSVRVGYVDVARATNRPPQLRQLAFEYSTAKVVEQCILTDDPARSNTAITTLRKDTNVTYLSRFYNTTAWDYIEVKVNGKTARGFVPAGSLDVPLDGTIPEGDDSLIE